MKKKKRKKISWQKKRKLKRQRVHKRRREVSEKGEKSAIDYFKRHGFNCCRTEEDFLKWVQTIEFEKGEEYKWYKKALKEKKRWAMEERKRLKQIKSALRRRGWLFIRQEVKKAWRKRKWQYKGYPDLFVWNKQNPKKKCFFCEVKSSARVGARISDAQIEKISKLYKRGFKTKLYYKTKKLPYMIDLEFESP